MNMQTFNIVKERIRKAEDKHVKVSTLTKAENCAGKNRLRGVSHTQGACEYVTRVFKVKKNMAELISQRILKEIIIRWKLSEVKSIKPHIRGTSETLSMFCVKRIIDTSDDGVWQSRGTCRLSLILSHKRNFKRKYGSQERSEHKTLRKQPRSWTADTLPQLLSVTG